ncbi:hypothetical protein AV521_00910 [Streptomyces sp. IMTB 2501]|uniref:DUF6777 domain-containing protein n=1 Tax=Streptomyces sp. IMTB 2501 TaxID=1776340 RepID=UPI00096F878E|nr:DUF6777 domain-containing protein [Streptomyces sp. IMTB 2501]OLZ74280.1 hypothetical protein AV521_00910 [Streptomyces sp. IMTB 2501]
MRIPTGSIALVCALSVALFVAGCVRPGVKAARMGVDVYLLPAAAQGPDPFTGSTVSATATPAAPGTGSADPTARAALGVSATGSPVAASSRPAVPAALLVPPPRAMRVLSGATPGLYGGTARVAGCDVARQIGYLTADRAKAGAFARTAGVSGGGLTGYLHGLTPVVLRADTRVSDHGYRDGDAVAYQAVLQAGTAVLVDNRGVPRVRCACGNPLGSPAPAHGGFGARGSAWAGYRPDQVIAVTPAPRAVTSFTIVNVETRTWIERRIGHDVRDDHVVPAPTWATAAPHAPVPTDTAAAGTAPPSSIPPGPQQTRPGVSPGTTGASPGTATPTAPHRPAGRNTTLPGTTDPWTPPSPGLPPDPPDAPDPPYGVGPLDGVGPPGTDLPDGGLVPYGIPSDQAIGPGATGHGTRDTPTALPGG